METINAPLASFFELSDSDIVVILDTNILLDILEKRNKKVTDFYKKCLLPFNKKGIITLGTTIYNIAEVLDKELELNFQMELLKRRLTADEIIRTSRNRQQLSREINNMNEELREKFYKKINNKLRTILRNTKIFGLDEITPDDYAILHDLILNGHLQSQDAMIVLTTYKAREYSSISSLITKDGYLVDSPLVNRYIEVYHPLRNKDVESFLEAISTIKADQQTLKMVEKIKRSLEVLK
ncbi:hypothetical protein [Thermococcus sp.]|uniref:hypothetical protein n=1 Tax=Thermococcus sp. TaxID=35749 RepID=UPI002604047C|nr:hypothetical protein [Thermococcus sp.]